MVRTIKDRSSPGYKELRESVKAGEIARLYVLTGEETFLMDRFIQLLKLTLIRPEMASLDQVTISTARAGNKLTIERVRAEVMTPPFLSQRRLVIIRQSGWFSPARSAKTVYADSKDTAESKNSIGFMESIDSIDSLDSAESDDSSGNSASVTNISNTSASETRAMSDQLIALLAELPDTACLVFCENKIDRRLKGLMAMVQKIGTLGEFASEQPAILAQWIQGECKKRSFKIERLAVESLIDRCDGQMQVLWNELNKLFLYASGKNLTTLDLSVIENLSIPDLRGTIFDLTDAISSGRTAQALILLDTLIAQKQPVQLILFMLARHFRQLIVAKNIGSADKITSRLKVMPFVATRLLNQSRSMPIEALEEQYLACFDTDLAVKTGKITDRLAIEMLLVSFSEQVNMQKNTAGNSKSNSKTMR